MAAVGRGTPSPAGADLRAYLAEIAESDDVEVEPVSDVDGGAQ
jgi:hypothetical protein